MKKSIVLIAILVLLAQSAFAETNTTLIITSQQPDPVPPGGVVELKVKIENSDTETQDDLLVEIVPQYPLSVIGEQQKRIGALRARQTGADAVILDFKLTVDPRAPEGNHTIDFRIQRENGAFQLFKDNIIHVKERKPVLDIANIETLPERLRPGERGKLRVHLLNDAASLIKDILVRIELAGIPIYAQSLSEKRLQQLNSGHQQAIDFDIIAAGDAAVKTYRLPVFIEFYDVRDIRHEINATTSLTVYDKPAIKAYLRSDQPIQLRQKQKITVEIVNQGTSQIKFLEVEVGETNDIVLLSTNKRTYIGDLDSDDVEREDYTIFPTGPVGQLALALRYTDAFNKEIAENITLSVPIVSTKDARRYGISQSNILWKIVVVFIIAAGCALYWKRRK